MTKKNFNKIGLIGAGAVGTSFVYSAINQGLAGEYVLIDAFPNAAEGNALDLSDTQAVLPNSFFSVRAGDYCDLKDANVIVITAGRPQKPGETRLEMVAGNALIMREIARQVKACGFNGITIVASNPVDVLTLVYQEETGFDSHRVISSGTTLDSARLRRLVGERLEVNSNSVQAFLIGEHGDSAVAVWSHATVFEQPIKDCLESGELEKIRHEAVHMAYKIIDLKRATFYGIGVCLARIVKAVLNNEHTILMIGAKLNGEYGANGVYAGVPAVINANGWESIVEWNLTSEEKTLFDRSISTLKKAVDAAHNALK